MLAKRTRTDSPGVYVRTFQACSGVFEGAAICNLAADSQYLIDKLYVVPVDGLISISIYAFAHSFTLYPDHDHCRPRPAPASEAG